ncbi:3-oxo-5-alpha-steroid 4-dehydrogenase-domain-containing protein [Chytridium lagenaria]|nr:3-oxo-5-alpha-steroid 4-dehydrogenase-domain-containing protein [Chytridium lagenaria]
MMNAPNTSTDARMSSLGSRHPSTAKMHLLHYAVGFAFYIITPIAVSCDKLHDLASVLTSKSYGDHSDDFEYRHVLAVVLFAYGSLEQNRAHLTLARLRNKPLVKRDSASPYKLPKGGWFDILACPHYFFELVIYAAMLIANWGVQHRIYNNSSCILVWIIVELGVIADVNHAWYRKTFPKTVPRKWYRNDPSAM